MKIITKKLTVRWGVIVLLASILITAAYPAIYRGVNGERAVMELYNSDIIQARIATSLRALEIQMLAGEKDIEKRITNDKLKEVLRMYSNIESTVKAEASSNEEDSEEKVDVERQVDDQLDYTVGGSYWVYQDTLTWMNQIPGFSYYVKDRKSNQVLTNDQELGRLESGAYSAYKATKFKEYDLVLSGYMNRGQLSLLCMQEKGEENPFRTAEGWYNSTFECAYLDSIFEPIYFSYQWEKPEEIVLYLAVKDASQIPGGNREIPFGYRGWSILWGYLIELLLVAAGVWTYQDALRKDGATTREFRSPLEVRVLILAAGMVLLPIYTLSYRLDVYNARRNVLGGMGVAVSLACAVYLAYYIANVRVCCNKEDVLQSCIGYRIYQSIGWNKKRATEGEWKVQKQELFYLLGKAILRTTVVLFGLWEILERMLPDPEYQEWALVGIVVCIPLLIVIWLRFRTQMKRQLLEPKQYHRILQKAKALAGGNYGEMLTEDLGNYTGLRDSLNQIDAGLKAAVEEAVRSQRMKTQLITNVSHDLKTPLTSIVSYVDLLKRKDLAEEEKREYIEILDQKSQRLKVLVEDLFEMSKASSGDMPLSYQQLNLVALVREVVVEHEMGMDEKGLKLNLSYISDQINVQLDGQKTYRILSNLMSNITKYAMPKTRVYISISKDEEEVLLEFKNTSAVELTYQGEELMERFVREDRARTTEGSGLGLAIAKSLTELQKGTMKVDAEADLFKVRLSFPLIKEA